MVTDCFTHTQHTTVQSRTALLTSVAAVVQVSALVVTRPHHQTLYEPVNTCTVHSEFSSPSLTQYAPATSQGHLDWTLQECHLSGNLEPTLYKVPLSPAQHCIQNEPEHISGTKIKCTISYIVKAKRPDAHACAWRVSE